MGGEFGGILGARRMLGDGLDDAAHVAQRDALSSRFCSTRCTMASGTCFGTRSSMTLGASFGEMIEQRLGFLPAEQFGGMAENHMIEMRGDHVLASFHRVAQGIRLVALAGLVQTARQVAPGLSSACPSGFRRRGPVDGGEKHARPKASPAPISTPLRAGWALDPYGRDYDF